MNVKIKNLFPCFAILFVALFLTASGVYGQEVLVRKDLFHTEIFLKIPPAGILSVAQDNFSVAVTFQKPMKEPFSKTLTDPFIESISGSGRELKIVFKSTADFAVFNDEEGLRFVATLPKTKEDVLLSYGVGAPLLRKENRYTEDPAASNLLLRADQFSRDNRSFDAVETLHTLIATTNNTYYLQEGMFRLGNLYMEMAKNNPAYYVDAANILDRFIISFPESNRLPQVRLMAAGAKRGAGMMSEAIAAYQAVYNTSADSESRREALRHMAELYTEIGQYDRAIAAYENYLNLFTTDSGTVRVKMGQLYLARGDKEGAFRQLTAAPASVLTEMLNEEELLAFGKILEEKGLYDKAAEIYHEVIQKEGPDKAEAMYRMAQTQKAVGNLEAYSKGLLELGQLMPESEFGLRALVEYAELHYAEKTADEWQEELAPVYETEDLYDLHRRAMMAQIKALDDDNDTARLLALIDTYVEQFPTSPDRPRLTQMKEDVLFRTAVQNQADGNYPLALSLYDQILAEFPDTPRKRQIVQSIDDIHYAEARALYDSGDFSGAVAFIENRITAPPPAGERWLALWEDAVYQDVLAGIGVVPPQITRFKAREYLTIMPRGRFVPQLRDILKEAFDYPFQSAFSGGDYVEVISLYDENKGWLDIWPDQAYANRVRILAATALVRMGMRQPAMELYQRITPMMTNEYAYLSYALCQRQTVYDINRLATDDFLDAIDEAGRCDDFEYVLSLIRSYTADKKAALQAEYALMKNIPDDAKRQEMLQYLYEQVRANEAARFDGYEGIYLDAGVAAYRRNDYSGALVPLKQYVDGAPGNDEKKSEALYYLGKALLAIGERAQGYEYMQQIVDSMPDSVYKSMARNELEDDAWRRSLNSN